jgi:hypothetical protein
MMFALETFAQRHLPSDICPYNICPEGRLPRLHLPIDTFAKEDNCPDNI